jgi:membrane dipeptidase
MAWHAQWPIADGHADTLTVLYQQKRSMFERSINGHLDLPRLREAGIDLQVLAVCSERRKNPGQWAKEVLHAHNKDMMDHPGEALALKYGSDWETWRQKKQTGFLLALEGLEPLEGQPGALRDFYKLGVRMASLTWNYTNEFAGGALETGGLTQAGRDAIAIMEELGMALDLSHLNRESFWQVIELNPQCPILVTHGNVDRLCPHARNLTDDQIKAVANFGGTVGVALFPPFLAGETAEIHDVIAHLSYIRSIGGIECPALGCDFDGIGKTLAGIAKVEDLPTLFLAIQAAAQEDPALVHALGNNLYRVLKRTGV